MPSCFTVGAGKQGKEVLLGLSKTRVLQSRVTIYRFQASQIALFVVLAHEQIGVLLIPRGTVSQEGTDCLQEMDGYLSKHRKSKSAREAHSTPPWRQGKTA